MKYEKDEIIIMKNIQETYYDFLEDATFSTEYNPEQVSGVQIVFQLPEKQKAFVYASDLNHAIKLGNLCGGFARPYTKSNHPVKYCLAQNTDGALEKLIDKNIILNNLSSEKRDKIVSKLNLKYVDYKKICPTDNFKNPIFFLSATKTERDKNNRCVQVEYKPAHMKDVNCAEMWYLNQISTKIKTLDLAIYYNDQKVSSNYFAGSSKHEITIDEFLAFSKQAAKGVVFTLDIKDMNKAFLNDEYCAKMVSEGYNRFIYMTESQIIKNLSAYAQAVRNNKINIGKQSYDIKTPISNAGSKILQNLNNSFAQKDLAAQMMSTNATNMGKQSYDIKTPISNAGSRIVKDLNNSFARKQAASRNNKVFVR